MARDETARGSKRKGLLNRRSYLKFAGATAATFAATGSTVGANEYETITVPAGETKSIAVGDGETFENKLIDMSASGASVLITTSGSGWTIRNVGFKGEHPGGHYLMTPGVSDPEGTALIENVYMGDGQAPRTKSGGIWVDANLPHQGTITFRNVHIAGMIDNGLYGSGPGAQGYGGNLHVESSYFKGNTISNVRLNSKTRPCNVTNTVIDTTGAQPCGVGCSAPGSTNTRAIWSWYGETHLRNCDIVGDIATIDGGTVTETNTRTGEAADLTPPKGVPMSAEQAASGAGGSSGNRKQAAQQKQAKAQGLPNVLSISSSDASTEANYEFEVTGKVKKSTERGGSKSKEDTIENGTVSGAVAGGTDSYQFAGTLTKFSLDGNATLFLNGKRVTPGKLGLPKTLVIDGSKGDGVSTYSFDVGGSVAKDDDLGSINDFDTISGKRVKGRVIDGTDAYRFSGDLKRIEIDGGAKAWVSVEQNQ
ncbi:hypothetical protein SAMN05421858_1783 [Haladaptatus litoreus]|uniref:Right handed beta helix region n=1 Tax=Haladaptatus litoreus TaxID=553468 RepID=A0A1N6YYQ6_9EURY|nr:hypothetical protein [Haladaptatus litoreus]SIR19655.1 hypothetical protein SAMN05421858_1783 [Haladaptatus litoreus]